MLSLHEVNSLPMKKTYLILLSLFTLTVTACNQASTNSSVSSDTIHTKSPTYFTWNNATIYFLLTDRFNNGNTNNDFVHPTSESPAALRGFLGGDIKGVTQKINEGYFDSLGVNAIWTTPVYQNIDGSVDEGTGTSYAYHGYWPKDWTNLDSRIASDGDYAEFVETAHQHGIRVIMDVIVNHTGPVTPLDEKWPDSWVRTQPKCKYDNAPNTITCTLVENLPDVKTESTEDVELPEFLIEKWKKEGRYEKEVEELDAFFTETNYPRRPYYYIIKWLVDYIKEYGIDGFRVDTAKHTEEVVWKDLRREADKAFAEWKSKNPDKVLDDNEFYMVGEVYNYSLSSGRLFDYGDKQVDFYDQSFDALVNFDFKSDANKNYQTIFSKYQSLLQHTYKDKSTLNYISSHDDSSPFDRTRANPLDAGTKLLLAQGGAQIYYGDETARALIAQANGDAQLRTYMNWDDLSDNKEIGGEKTKEILDHWRKLGTFRQNHPSVGAGVQYNINTAPYIFARRYVNANYIDGVIIGLDQPIGSKKIPVDFMFKDGETVRDAYSGATAVVKNGFALINSLDKIVLLEAIIH